jgi:hypothetical protein
VQQQAAPDISREGERGERRDWNRDGERRDWSRDGERRDWNRDGERRERRDWNRDRRGPRTHSWSYDEARRYHRRERRDRTWWRSNYSRFALFGGGYYYWDRGYWYPAYGYDPGYSTYTYDEPIYGYNQMEPRQVMVRVQRELRRDGYYRGPIDGLIGPMTRAALARFQRDNGLYVTRRIDGPDRSPRSESCNRTDSKKFEAARRSDPSRGFFLPTMRTNCECHAHRRLLRR